VTKLATLFLKKLRRPVDCSVGYTSSQLPQLTLSISHRMHVPIWQALRSLPRTSLPRSCRFVAGRRHPLATRSFHRSAVAYRNSEDPVAPSDSTWIRVAHDAAPKLDNTESLLQSADGPEPANTTTEGSQTTKDRSNYGSAARRAGRNVPKTKTLPQVPVSVQFLEKNVSLQEELRAKPELLDKVNSNVGLGATGRDGDIETEDTSKATQPSASPVGPKATNYLLRSNRYEINPDVWLEIRAHVATGLNMLSEQHPNSFPATKTHLLLHCPEDGGMFFLDAVVESIAADTGADLLSLDPQDLAELGAEYLGDAADVTPYSLRSLGYDAHRVVSRQEGRELEDSAEEEDEYDDDPDDVQSQASKGNPSIFAVPMFTKISTTVPVTNIQATISEFLKNSGHFKNGIDLPKPQSRSTTSSTESADDAKLSYWIDSVLNTCYTKKAMGEYLTQSKSDAHIPGPDQKSINGVLSEAELDGSRLVIQVSELFKRSQIVLIRDYKELNATREGSKILALLLAAVRKRRKNGQRIMVVGATSSVDLVPSVSKAGLKSLQSESEDTAIRTIVVPPGNHDHNAVESSFAEDLKLRTTQINLRHLRDMIKRLSFDSSRTNAIVQAAELAIDSAQAFASGLGASIWPFDRVHRTAVLSLGLLNGDEVLNATHIERALRLTDSSDQVKYEWLNEEQQRGGVSNDPASQHTHKPGTTAANRANDEKMKQLRKTCTTHEKKLLGGVINVENIHTTFADVQAPPENIEALKTLTSLSLIRPEAFTYGVLATDRIPGLLLYGPPGTGKTLLAKAVAKESGATVLEVSGSEIYDMYVGEGEKNVKAIFSLAQKLKPCIVFIDEADAIFGSRGGAGSTRTSHRELINQFLREWDGVNDLAAFIMVATNRPFDLDDAVLRRLPRRLLVDLPREPDRLAILSIHLRHEVLAPDVDLPFLAAQTPLYSGSDLKNLAVAAALACIREENAEAAKHTGPEPYRHPEKRVLRKRHFERALEEISASISEDMSSLAAIRKFDEKYGDRRGRRKKSAGWGFGTVSEAERRGEGGRVRTQT